MKGCVQLSQIFNYLKNERKSLDILVSKADVEYQNQFIDASKTLKAFYKEFNKQILNIQEKIPLTDLFSHISRFCVLFLDLDDYFQANSLLTELESILRQASVNSSLYFQGKMSLAFLKGNVQLKLLNLSKAEEMYNYIVRRRSEAKITDLYGALISLAIISLYKYRIF